MEFRHSKGHTPLSSLALAADMRLEFRPLACKRGRATWTVVDPGRPVCDQDQGAWVIDYRLRNAARAGVIVTPEEIRLKVEGWVSNSPRSEPRGTSMVVRHYHSELSIRRLSPT